MKTPLISVIITTHKRPNLLSRCLESLRNQNFKDFEILLFSDIFCNETREVANNFLTESDTLFMSSALKGPAETRNLGISLSRGSWICFIDDDDTFDQSYLFECTRFLSSNPIIHFFNYNIIKEQRSTNAVLHYEMQKKLIYSIDTEILFIGNFIPINSLLFPSIIVKQYSFDKYLKSHEDWDFLINLKSKGCIFEGHDMYGPNVHIDIGNNTRNNSGSKVLDYLSIFRKWPASSIKTQELRSNELKLLGLDLSGHYL